jgi:hypothetical protein
VVSKRHDAPYRSESAGIGARSRRWHGVRPTGSDGGCLSAFSLFAGPSIFGAAHQVGSWPKLAPRGCCSHKDCLRRSEKLTRLQDGRFAVMCTGLRDMFLHASAGVPGLRARPVEAFNYSSREVVAQEFLIRGIDRSAAQVRRPKQAYNARCFLQFRIAQEYRRRVSYRNTLEAQGRFTDE